MVVGGGGWGAGRGMESQIETEIETEIEILYSPSLTARKVSGKAVCILAYITGAGYMGRVCVCVCSGGGGGS